MQRKPKGEAGERTRGDGEHGERHVLAVGKRVQKRWLVELSLVSPRVVRPLGVAMRSAQHAA
jgi:hypothetical protein